jgi:hypothetical protein
MSGVGHAGPVTDIIEDPYPGAPPIADELAALMSTSGREQVLRAAAVMDGVALAGGSGNRALYECALHAAQGLVDRDGCTDVAQPLQYLREQYRTWRADTG